MAGPPKGFPTDIVWSTLDSKEQKLFSNLYSKIDTLEKKTQERQAGMGPDRASEAILDLTASIENFDQKLLNQIEESIENMSKSGAFFAREAGFVRGIQQATKELFLLFGSTEKAAAAFQFLATNMSGFGQMRDVLARNNKALTGELAKQAAMFERAGMSASTFKDNVDTMIYSFGLNAREVQSFNFQIRKLSEDLNMMPEQVSRNFQLVAKNLSYDIGTVSEQFARMQKLSLQTGVDISTISGRFGEGMDTISGASGAAANINALLGRNAFSATELLMMDEATRAERIREEIMNDPRLRASIASGGAEAKFALDTVKEILGMSRDDARRYITTGKLADADKPKPADPAADEKASLKSKISQQLDLDVTQSVIKDFGITVKDIDVEFGKLVKDIKLAQLTHTERENLTIRRDRLLRNDREVVATRARGAARQRPVPSALSPRFTGGRQMRLTEVESYAQIYPELERRRESGSITEPEFNELVQTLENAIGLAPMEQDRAAADVQAALDARTPGARATKTSEGRRGVETLPLASIDAISSIPFTNQRDRRTVMRKLREMAAQGLDASAQKSEIEKIDTAIREEQRLENMTADERKKVDEAASKNNTATYSDQLAAARKARQEAVFGTNSPQTKPATEVADEYFKAQQDANAPQTPQSPTGRNLDTLSPASNPVSEVNNLPRLIAGQKFKKEELDRLVEMIKQGQRVFNIERAAGQDASGQPTKAISAVVTVPSGAKLAELKAALESDNTLTIEEFNLHLASLVN